MSNQEQPDDSPCFYCPKCGGVRVAVAVLTAVNRFPDGKGNMIPTVSIAELLALTEERTAAGDFEMYCCDCKESADKIIDDEGFASRFPGSVN